MKFKRFIARIYIKFFERAYDYIDFKKEVITKHPKIAENMVQLFLSDCQTYTIEHLKTVLCQDYYINKLFEYSEFKKICYSFLTSDVLRENEFASKFWSDYDIRNVAHELTYNDVTKKNEYSNKFWQEPAVKTIYKNLAKKALVKDKEYIIECLKDKQIKKQFFTEILYDEDILIGGISKCEYYSKQKVLRVTGWFIPVNNYDSIEIYNGDVLLGNAILRTYRPDVKQRHYNANESYSGWELIHEGIFSQKSSILVLVRKNREIIWRNNAQIEIIDAVIKDNDTNKELLVIKKNGKLYEEINIHALKRMFDQLLVIDNDIRRNMNSYEIQRYTNQGLVSKVDIKLIDKYKPFCGIDDLMGGCSNHNVKFYYNYMSGSSGLRILDDYHFIKRHIFDKKTKILDVGAIPPMLTYLLNNDGFDNITVIDPAAEDFKTYFDKHKIIHYNGNILLDEFYENETYDLIIFTEVIEHLSGNILDAIDRIKSYLNKEGLLYLTTPNEGSISGFFALLHNQSGLASKPKEDVYRQYQRLETNGYFGHIREYTSFEIVKLMEKMGFELVAKICKPEFRQTENSIIVGLENIYSQYGIWGKYLFKKIG